MFVGLSFPLYLEQIHKHAQVGFSWFLKQQLDFSSQGRQLQRDSTFLRPALWFDLHGENVDVGWSRDVVVKRNLGKKIRRLLRGR